MIRLSFILAITTIVACAAQQTQKLLIGNWAKSKNENVEFIIDETKFRFFEADYYYDYVFKGNRLTVLDSNKLILSFNVKKISKDSLIIVSQNDGNRGVVYRYYKVK